MASTRLAQDRLIHPVTALDAVEPALTQESVIYDLRHVNAWGIQAKVTNGTPTAKSYAPTDVTLATDTINEVAHGYVTGLVVRESTTGGLPAPLAAATDYFVIRVDADNYKLATSLANAVAGTAIDITTQGTGTHTTTPSAFAGTVTVNYAASPNEPVAADWFSSGKTIALSAVTLTGLTTDSNVPFMWLRVIWTPTAGQGSLTVNLVARKQP